MILRKKRKRTFGRVFIDIITFRWLFYGLIAFYKHTFSKAVGKSCIYTPTCSTYMYQAIDEWGTIRGVTMGIARIIRCNPLARGGLDRVPLRKRGDLKWLY